MCSHPKEGKSHNSLDQEYSQYGEESSSSHLLGDGEVLAPLWCFLRLRQGTFSEGYQDSWGLNHITLKEVLRYPGPPLAAEEPKGPSNSSLTLLEGGFCDYNTVELNFAWEWHAMPTPVGTRRPKEDIMKQTIHCGRQTAWTKYEFFILDGFKTNLQQM